MLSGSVISDSCDPMDYSLLGSSVPGFSRQQHRSELPFPSSGDLPDPGIEPMTPEFPALADGFFAIVPPGKPNVPGKTC